MECLFGFRTIIVPTRNGVRRLNVLCEDEDYFDFWQGFASDCPNVVGVVFTYVLVFLSKVFSDDILGMYRRWGDRFLLDEESFWEWFSYWKAGYVASRDHSSRFCVHLAVHAVRYCIQRNPQGWSLGPVVESMVMGKEFATFILEAYTGKGAVGFCRTSDGNRTVAMEVAFSNRFLQDVYISYFESGIGTNRVSEFWLCQPYFEQSLGEHCAGISSYADFSEVTFFAQVEFFRRLYADRDDAFQKIHKANRHIIGFYRYLLSFEECCRTFSFGTLSPALVKNMNFSSWVYAGLEFVDYHGIPDDECRPKAIVVLKDIHSLGTRYVNGEGIMVDLSFVQTPFYRNVLWRYIQSSLQFLLGGNRIRIVADALACMEKLIPAGEGCTSVVLTNDVSHAIRHGVLVKNVADMSLFVYFLEIRKFFEWAGERGFIRAENVFTLTCFQHRQRNSYPKQKRNAVPLEHVRKLLAYFEEKARESFRWRLFFLMLNLLCGTKFRPNQICKMNVLDISLFEEGDVCFIDGVTKVSSGDTESSPVSRDVYNMLAEVIDASAEMRERCHDEALRECVFLYESCNGFVRLRENNFRSALGVACKDLGIPVYPPYSFRRTYATVWDELDRLLGHHGDLAAQGMGHAQYKTTVEHYIDRTFKEFLRVGDANSISSDEYMLKEYEKFKHKS